MALIVAVAASIWSYNTQTTTRLGRCDASNCLESVYISWICPCLLILDPGVKTGNGINTTSAGQRDTSDDAVSRTTWTCSCPTLCAWKWCQDEQGVDEQGVATSDHRCKPQSRRSRFFVFSCKKHTAQRNATGIAARWDRLYTSTTSFAS